MLICHCTLAYDLYYDHCSKCRKYLEYYQLSKTQIKIVNEKDLDESENKSLDDTKMIDINIKTFIKKQKSIDSEINDIVNKNFEDLI